MFDKLQSMMGGANFKLDWKFFIIILSIAVLIGAIVYVYQNYVAPKLDPQYVANKEFVTSSNDGKIAHIYLFSTSWCPHCRNLKKEGIWDQFTRDNQGKTVNGYTLNIQEIDCSNDKDAEIKNTLDKFNVDGFPSIKLLKDGDQPSQAIDYDAKPQIDSLNQFVSTVL
jgi:thiol-disulfide isomerase/thioredoxin